MARSTDCSTSMVWSCGACGCRLGPQWRSSMPRYLATFCRKTSFAPNYSANYERVYIPNSCPTRACATLMRCTGSLSLFDPGLDDDGPLE